MNKEKLNDTTRPLQVLVAKILYAPEDIAGPVAVVIDGTSIHAIWRVSDAYQARQLCAERWPEKVIEVRDLGSWIIAPGYIDIHTHGFHGHDITSGTQEDIAAMACEIPRIGVTSFFPTIATTSKAETVEQIERIVAVATREPDERSAEIAGIRLEGPFISRAKKGAQYEPAIRLPILSRCTNWPPLDVASCASSITRPKKTRTTPFWQHWCSLAFCRVSDTQRQPTSRRFMLSMAARAIQRTSSTPCRG